jgi:anti-anti-sigma regulatory factor
VASSRLILCNINFQIYEVFEITKLNRLFNIQKEECATPVVVGEAQFRFVRIYL